MRNLSDKNCVKDLMSSVSNFLNETEFPEMVGLKEMQKIDKQSFIRYFNVSNFFYKMFSVRSNF